MTYNPQQPYYQQQGPTYGPQEQQFQYQPPQQPYPYPVPNDNPQQNYGNSKESLEFTQTFKIEEPRYNDLWAAISFLLTFAGFTALSVYCINGYDTDTFSRNKGLKKADAFALNANTIVLFACVVCIAFVTSLTYFWIIRIFTKQSIWISGVLQVVFGLGTAFYYFRENWYSAGIAYLVFSIFYIICFITWIPRIPFSVLMLQTIIDVSKKYGHVFYISLLGGLTATIFAAWFAVTMVSIYAKFYPGGEECTLNDSCSQGKVIGLLIFITFAGYWITEVIKNVIHVSISGVYGSWYFYSKKPGGFPKGSTRGAFGRAITYSFGSISLGSLLVAIIQLLRQACSIASQNEAAEGNIFGVCFFCCMQFLISILEWAIEFLNEYAFSYIALYGKSYIPAAKATWKMMKDRGVDAIVNECLINPVLTMGAVFVAYLSSLFAFLYLQFTKPSYNEANSFTVLVMAFAFLIGLQIANIFLVPIKSGVATFFVAMAFDPQVLIMEYPDLWQRMIQVYPHIQAAIHV